MLSGSIKSTLNIGSKDNFNICNCYSRAWQLAIEKGYPVEQALRDVQETSAGGDCQVGALMPYRDKENWEHQKKLSAEYLETLKKGTSWVCEHSASEQEKALALEAVAIFSEIRELAEQPKGSLITFNKAVQDLESRRTRCINQLDAMR